MYRPAPVTFSLPSGRMNVVVAPELPVPIRRPLPVAHIMVSPGVSDNAPGAVLAGTAGPET